MDARIVIDNNVLISSVLIRNSISGAAVRKAINTGQLLISEATLAELASVLSRSKFDKYLTVRERQDFLRLLTRIAELVPIVHRVEVCRDRKDNMILEVGINGGATLIITGDDDLLNLHTFEGIPITQPADYAQEP